MKNGNLAPNSILVSATYRLGALGFLSVERAAIHGTFTVQDLLLTLRWVQANIAVFGGDSVSIPEICFLTY
jgi:carboxylesterase type B